MFCADPADAAWKAAAAGLSAGHWLENADFSLLDLGPGFESAGPISFLNRQQASDSYVISPMSAWLRYPLAEASRHLGRGVGPWARLAAGPVQGVMAAARLGEAVGLGNYLVSTNLYPERGEAALRPLLARVLESCPDRPLQVRSLSPELNPQLCLALAALGFDLVVSRKIYTCDPASPELWRHNHVRKDQKLLQEPSVQVVPHAEIRHSDLPELHRLFRMLFIDKHSVLNPAFSLSFFQFCLDTRFLEFYGLRYQGRWVGVVALYVRHGYLTTPLIGYDTSLPQPLGLYRRLMALLYREALARNLKLHLSSGADSFKLARGGVMSLEYTGLYSRHLPWMARRATQVFVRSMNACAPRMLKRVV